jgi:hypothetical protein
LAEPIPLAELELRIALLPPVSRGAHLGGPTIHAERLVELWKIEDGDDVPLEQAFRLLDVKAVARAILRTALMSDNDYPNDPVYWPLPPLNDLLPELHDAAWEALLDGTLLVEAIKGLRGARRRAVLPVELVRLRPDWSLSRLCLGERDEFIAARVRRAPTKPVKSRWREHSPEAVVHEVMHEIAEGYPPGARPAFAEILKALRGHDRLGPEVTRAQAQNALKKVAPHLRGQRGYRAKT